MEWITPTSLSSDWTPAPVNFALQPGDVHLWIATLDRDEEYIQRMGSLLSEDERQRASRFRFPHLQKRFILARGILRMLLSRYLAVDPLEIRFTYNAMGKPAVTPDMQFNLSHSGGLVLIGITQERPIGVDLEQIRPITHMENVTSSYFSPAEIDALNSLPPGEKLSAFYACWTRKEAFIKATGKGLSQRLSGFSVSLKPEEPARLLSLEDLDLHSDWALEDIAIHPDYRAALAVEGQAGPIYHWIWQE